MRLNLRADGPEQQAVLQYLESNASDVLAEKINNGSKTLEGCWKFIESQAKKKAKGQNCVCCTDQEVFGWAVHYFEEESIKEGGKAAVEKGDTYKVTPTGIKKVKEEKKKPEPKEPKKEEPVMMEGQITLFDFVGG